MTRLWMKRGRKPYKTKKNIPRRGASKAKLAGCLVFLKDDCVAWNDEGDQDISGNKLSRCCVGSSLSLMMQLARNAYTLAWPCIMWQTPHIFPVLEPVLWLDQLLVVLSLDSRTDFSNNHCGLLKIKWLQVLEATLCVQVTQ